MPSSRNHRPRATHLDTLWITCLSLGLALGCGCTAARAQSSEVSSPPLIEDGSRGQAAKEGRSPSEVPRAREVSESPSGVAADTPKTADEAMPSDAPKSRPPWRLEGLDGKDPALWERALRLHSRAIIVDGHNDITSAILDRGFDLGAPEGHTHTDLQRLLDGGMTGLFFSIYVNRRYAEKPTPRGGGAARRALDMIDISYQQVERHSDHLVLARTAQDIREAKEQGKIAVLLGIEGGHAIENSLYALRSFYRLGIRYMTLTHANSNAWADASGTHNQAKRRHGGLTDFGEAVVREMQRIGMLVDISHVSDETFDDVLRIAQAPVIASHSSARALARHPRNLSDEMLRKLGVNGGLVMVNFYNAYIDPAVIALHPSYKTLKRLGKEAAHIRAQYPTDRVAREAALDALHTRMGIPRTPLKVLVDHIAHIAQVAGIDHVGLGSDFDGIPVLPDGLSGVDQLPNLTYALLERGFSDKEVLKILGGNFLRVLETAEHFASDKGTLSGDGDTRTIDG